MIPRSRLSRLHRALIIGWVLFAVEGPHGSNAMQGRLVADQRQGSGAVDSFRRDRAPEPERSAPARPSPAQSFAPYVPPGIGIASPAELQTAARRLDLLESGVSPDARIGEDDRISAPLDKDPFTAIGVLHPRGCTAFMISPNQALSNAHCVTMNRTDSIIDPLRDKPTEVPPG
jgi:hypothetical protein